MDAQVLSCIGACSIIFAPYLHCVPSFALDIGSLCRHAISSARISVNCIAIGELDCVSSFALDLGNLCRHAIFSARISVNCIALFPMNYRGTALRIFFCAGSREPV